MNYYKQYQLLMNKRRQHKLSKKQCYCERHHIIPKSIGGSNSSYNLVNLTAKEHFIAHRLLEKLTCQIYGKNSSQHRHMAQALWLMMHNKKYPNNKMTARSYESIRIMYSQSISGENNRQHMRRGRLSKLFGRKQTKQSKQRNSASHTGRVHMHNPIDDKGICVKKKDVQTFLANGYVIGMSKHEIDAISKRNRTQKHMYHPETDHQVYAQPKDVDEYLKKGYIFGRNKKSCKKHNDKLRGRIAFYDKDTHKMFYVERNEVEATLKCGHVISNNAKVKLNIHDDQ